MALTCSMEEQLKWLASLDDAEISDDEATELAVLLELAGN